MRWMASMPSWCFPNQLIKLGMLLIFFDEIPYGNNRPFQEIEDLSKFYHGKSLTVSSKARGMGLGTELIKQTNKNALDKGCSHVYIAATSVYSQGYLYVFCWALYCDLSFDSPSLHFTFHHMANSNFQVTESLRIWVYTTPGRQPSHSLFCIF